VSLEPKHNYIFAGFRRWAGSVPAGFDVDFLGTRYRTSFFTMWRSQPHDRDEAPTYPPFDEEYFEWIDLLEAVASAKNRFTMLELGAGFGRWTVRAAAAAKQRNVSYSLIAVEAEPTHFDWLRENLQDNNVDLANCRLILAAATGKDGKIGFQVGDAENSYGQAIGGNTEVEAISLSTLLLPCDLVDLVDMDVQGAELDILVSATELLVRKVKRVHVETHSQQLHTDILRLFRSLGWKPHFLYAGDTADKTPWGRINFQGGTQSWLNPGLCSRNELRETPTFQNSTVWRAMRLGRRLVDRVAPRGTLRRRVYESSLAGFGSRYRRDSAEASRRPMTW
jgi:FkbM family methyltransferase